MAGEYEGLNASELQKAIAQMRAQLPGMRAEAQAINSELASGNKSLRDLESQGRRGARIGAATGATVPADSERAAQATARQARASQNVARAEQQALAVRQRSLDVVRRISLLNRSGAYGIVGAPAAVGRLNAQLSDTLRMYRLIGGPGLGAGGGYGGLRGPVPPALPPGRTPLALPAGRTPLALPPAGATIGGARYTEGVNQTAAATDKATRATSGFSSNLQRNQAILGASSTDMRRFGALTTEFISAAGRGAVTVRELGYQVTSTIGKFGGWLGAGAAVYGAFGALQAVGRGAIDTSSGISQLSRVVSNVDADTTAEQFRDLAGSFNLPIDDVSSAAFEMGKIFNNQNDALEATKAVLASVKVGELDVATSSRYLTSIIQAFGLPATEMASVFDQINQAQNQFGVRIEDTLAGLAKASGTFKAAGGDIDTLLALITTAKRATGQTGEVIGTALARAPNFLRKDQNKNVLEGFGIDAGGSITDVINQAFDKAQTLGGERLQQLAAAIFGPQYGARVGTPLLQQFELYQQVLADTSPEASKGSAERELQSVLAQTSEQLSKVMVQLEILGSNLSEAGFFTPFAFLLKTLNLVLTTVNSIVGLFNHLPQPIRYAVTAMGQFVGLIALARRFNIGQSFGAGSIGSRLFTRRNQPQFLYREGLTKQRDVLAQEADSSARAATRSSLGVSAARQTVVQEEAALAKQSSTAMKGVVLTEEEVLAQEGRVTAARNQLVAAQEAEVAAMTKNRAVLRESLLVQTQLTALRNGMTAEQSAAMARSFGVIPPTSVGPNAASAAALADPAIQRTLAPDLIRAQNAIIGQDLRASAAAPGRLSQLQTRLATNIKGVGVIGGVLKTGGQEITRASQFLGSQIGATNFSRIRTAGNKLGTSLGRTARGILNMLGPLDVILIGGFLLFDAFSKGQQRVDELNQLADDASTADSAETFAASLEEMRSKLESTGGFGDASSLFGPLQAANEQFAEIDQLTRTRSDVVNAITQGIKLPEGAGASAAFAYAEDITAGIEAMKKRTEYVDHRAKSLKKNGQALVSWVKAMDLDEAEQADLIKSIKIAQVEALGYKAGYDRLAATAGEGLDTRISTFSEAVGTGLAGVGTQNELFDNALVQAAENINAKKPENLAFAGAAIDALAESVSEAAKSELDRSLAFADSQEERNRAYRDYLNATTPASIRSRYARLAGQQAENLKNQAAIAKSLRQQIANAPQPGDEGPGGQVPGIHQRVARAQNLKDLREELEKHLKRIKEIRSNIDGLTDAEKQAVERLRAIRQEIKLQRFEEDQDLIQGRGDLRASRAGEGLPTLRVNLRVIGRLLQNAIKQYGRDSKEVLDLLGEQQSARDEIVQAQLDLITARSDYRAAAFAGPGQEIQRAKVELQGLYQQLAFMQAHKRQFSAADILGLQTQIREAEGQLAQDAADQAQELKDALFDIRIARAEAQGNDVAAARAQLAKALFDLQSASTPLEKRQARAEVINQRAALRDSIFQRQIEDIEFQADIGKLTLQQQIRAYQELLNTANITRDQRRDLRRKIYQLKQEADSESGDFDLQVGQIKLPTIYEIRRAIQGGGVGNNTNVSITNQNNINVNGAQDPSAVGDDVAYKLGTQTKSAMRSAGLL